MDITSAADLPSIGLPPKLDMNSNYGRVRKSLQANGWRVRKKENGMYVAFKKKEGTLLGYAEMKRLCEEMPPKPKVCWIHGKQGLVEAIENVLLCGEDDTNYTEVDERREMIDTLRKVRGTGPNHVVCIDMSEDDIFSTLATPADIVVVEAADELRPEDATNIIKCSEARVIVCVAHDGPRNDVKLAFDLASSSLQVLYVPPYTAVALQAITNRGDSVAKKRARDGVGVVAQLPALKRPVETTLTRMQRVTASYQRLLYWVAQAAAKEAKQWWTMKDIVALVRKNKAVFPTGFSCDTHVLEALDALHANGLLLVRHRRTTMCGPPKRHFVIEYGVSHHVAHEAKENISPYPQPSKK